MEHALFWRPKEAGEEPDETLADRVKRLRKLKGWSMDRLGRETGMTRAQISLVENGTTKSLRKATRDAYATALGVPPDYLEYGIVIAPERGVQWLDFESWCRGRGELATDDSIRAVRVVYDRLVELERFTQVSD